MVMQDDWLGTAQQAFESVVSTEARLVVTVVLIGVWVGLTAVLLPRGVQRAVSLAERWLADAEDSNTLVTVNESADISFPSQLVVRVGQVATAVSVGVALLLVWGYVSVASRITSTLVGFFPAVTRVTFSVGLLVAGIVGTRVVRDWLRDYTEASNTLNQHQEGVIYRVLQLTIFTSVGLAALSLWNINLGGLLVGAGFLGIVVGMAARQTLGAMLAGFVLMLSRPFKIGDWVVIGDEEGIVTDIRSSTLAPQFDGEEVVMPNDQVSDTTVTNRTKRGQLRIRTEVGIDYDADIERAETLAMEAIESVDDVATAPKPHAIPTGFGDSAVVLELRYWIRNPSARKRWQTSQMVIRAVKSRFDEAGITIPYPQREFSSREDGSLPPATEMHAPEGTPAEQPDTPQD
ncbi:MAG: small-conductance mechanosensitive channel [uncultured archaeon A07HR60]|nr:MAG: small-conductance mechanosensitive channel [uncultured archaeon A07HR60]